MRLVALDLETTGIAPGFDRIIEVGAQAFHLGATGDILPGETFERLVDPQRVLPRPTQELTGITQAELDEAAPFDAVWPELERFLSEPNTILVAHSGRFDLDFLVAETARLDLAWQGPAVTCTLRIAREVFPNAPKYRLANLIDWLGLGDQAPVFHRAVPDAIHARNLFAATVRARGARSLSEIRAARPLPVPGPEDFLVQVPDALAFLEPYMEQERPVGLIYRGGSKGRDPRSVTPLCFYKSEGVVFLRGWCHVDDAAKSFRCDRIAKVLLPA